MEKRSTIHTCKMKSIITKQYTVQFPILTGTDLALFSDF